MDDHLGDAGSNAFGADAEKAIREAWSRPRSELLRGLEAQRAALRTPGDLLDHYRALNRPEAQRELVAFDFGGNLRHESPGRWGRQYVAGWEARNLHMAANIRAAFAGRPGARVLVLVGASHKAYLDAYLDLMHDVRLADAEAVLR